MQVHWRTITHTRRLGSIARFGADTAPPVGGELSNITQLRRAVEHAPNDVLHDGALLDRVRAP